MKPYILLAAVLLSAAVVSAQKESVDVRFDKNTAPISWIRYKVSSADSAVMLPKLPVKIDLGVPCDETRGSVYYAYADEAIYEFRFYLKDPPSPGRFCSSRRYFGPDTLERRLAEIRSYKPAPTSETDGELNFRKIKVFRWETPNEIAMRWVIPDLGNDRWRELALNYRLDKKPDEKLFLKSLAFTAANGIEIFLGSPVTIGDEVPDVTTPPAGTIGNPVAIIGKPSPPYTNAAREKNTTGTVRLKVTFLANGAIGNIEVVSALPNGLTEEAIAAAKRIVFLPARANGVPFSIVKTVEYSFIIL